MKVLELSRHDEMLKKSFTEVAREVYQGDPVWEVASETEFSSHWERQPEQPDELFQPILVTDNDQPVARAVAILRNAAVDETGKPQGYIGFFECLENRADAALAALEYCELLLRKAGARSVLAPKADNQLFGCQTSRFDLPHVCLTPHNPPYYQGYFEAAGYQVNQHINSMYFTRDVALGEVKFTLPGYQTREFDRTRLDEEIALFHNLQPQVFSDRSGYIRRTLAEDRAMIEGLLPYMDDELIIIAEHDRAGAVGILVCLPDYYQALAGREMNRARIITIGILPKHVKNGVGTLMGAHLMRNLLRKKNYLFAEASLVLARNLAPQALADRFPAQPGRSFVLFDKSF